MLLGLVLLKWKMKNLNTNNLKLKLSYHFRMLTKGKEIRNFENSNEKTDATNPSCSNKVFFKKNKIKKITIKFGAFFLPGFCPAPT